MLETIEQRENARQWFDIARDAGPWESEAGCDCFLCEFGRRVNDPAALAQLLDVEGRRLNVKIALCANDRELMRSTKRFAIVVHEHNLALWDELNVREVNLTDAQHILRQWIELPDGDNERAELALRSPS